MPSNVRQSARCARDVEAVARRVLAQQLDRVLGPVDRRHRGPARGRDERRHAEPAAELDHREPVDPRSAARGRARVRRPQLRPVRHELVPGEGLLVDQLLRLARPQQRELDLADTDLLLDELSEQRVEPDRDARRQLAELLEREQDAGRERLARGRVVADRQRLARARRGSPPGARRAPAAAPSGSARRRCHAPPRSPSPCPTARRASSRGGARRSRPRRGSAEASAAKRIISTAPIAKFGAKKTGSPPPARASRRPRPCPSRSCRRRTGRPASSARRTFGTTASGVVKSTIASASASVATSSCPALDERRPEHRADLAHLGRGRRVAVEQDLHAARASVGVTRSSASRNRSSLGPMPGGREPLGREQHGGELADRLGLDRVDLGDRRARARGSRSR